mgnify:CR=1 FL=1
MKVMSYNTMHGVDHMHRMKTKETVVNLDGIVSVIAKYAPDIVGLNEMYDAPVENLENQVGYLANKLGYEYYYFAGAIDIKGGKYGNGLLSRYPIKKVEKIMIPDSIIKNEDAFYETRCIIKSVIEVDGIQHNTLEHKNADIKRDEVLAEWGITVLRYSNESVNENFTHVVMDILDKLGLNFADLQLK